MNATTVLRSDHHLFVTLRSCLVESDHTRRQRRKPEIMLAFFPCVQASMSPHATLNAASKSCYSACMWSLNLSRYLKCQHDRYCVSVSCEEEKGPLLAADLIE